jgi:hypothetical protein
VAAMKLFGSAWLEAGRIFDLGLIVTEVPMSLLLPTTMRDHGLPKKTIEL